MKNLPLLFCGIFFAMALSWTGLILASQIQFGNLQPTTSTLVNAEGELIAGTTYQVEGPDGKRIDVRGDHAPGEPLYPQEPVGLAQQGKQIYIEMGCMYCHSQQVRRKGFGSDYERGWGARQTVPRDYILQDRVLLGTMRTGPDLMNVGDRGISANDDWHHLHLYNPQITSPGSNMPPFAFLYVVKPINGEPAENALNIGPDSPYYPGEGMQIVPTARAEALVAYLRSLNLRYGLPEAPIIEE
ncbi:MAG: cbb3-type cytochrome c oxidase subunit II [Opitutales bacterium]